MKISTTLLRPTAGQVTIDGRSVEADPDYVRQRLGYLPQEFGFPKASTPTTCSTTSAR
ncbi:MAG: hypothetical protein U0521_03575 [Anaerolineae bacterium]